MNVSCATKIVPSFHVLAISQITGTAVAQWLKCCATNRKVAASIPAGVIGDFSLTQNPSGRAMTMGSIQHLTEMSTRSISLG